MKINLRKIVRTLKRVEQAVRPILREIRDRRKERGLKREQERRRAGWVETGEGS